MDGLRADLMLACTKRAAALIRLLVDSGDGHATRTVLTDDCRPAWTAALEFLAGVTPDFTSGYPDTWFELLQRLVIHGDRRARGEMSPGPVTDDDLDAPPPADGLVRIWELAGNLK